MVLVPAHDEETGLPITLAELRTQLAAGDRVLVIADNCTDGTARVARAAGADVLERTDAHRRGKGYALAAGVQALAAAPALRIPRAVIRVCVAGVTGWTGSAVAEAVGAATDLELVAGVARSDQASFSSVAEALDAV